MLFKSEILNQYIKAITKTRLNKRPVGHIAHQNMNFQVYYMALVS